MHEKSSERMVDHTKCAWEKLKKLSEQKNTYLKKKLHKICAWITLD
jgi:hypothetical protein